MTELQYSPLDKNEIRLFDLEPGSDADIISGHLRHHSEWGHWPGSKEYEALSYVWGSAEHPSNIRVNGRIVTVTESLHTALRQLRYPDRPRTLWIDYLCINQRDVNERSNEVARMGIIYGNAEDVLIWLGPATPDSVIGMEIPDYFANETRPKSCPVWQTYSQATVLRGLQDIFSRPWFQRMWVVQEIGQSHRAVLTCGQHSVEWESTNCLAVRRFVRMIKYAVILPEWTQLGLGEVSMQPLLDMLDFQDANQFSKSWGACNRAAPDLLDLAYNLRHKQCTDPRDKIFGIWGLVDYLDDLQDFKLDYNMSVKEAYEEVARVSFR